MGTSRDLSSVAGDKDPAPDRAVVLAQLREDLDVRSDVQQAALVHIEIGLSGKVTAVRIHRDWRTSLSPAALGEAVLDGYSFVVGQRVTEAAVATLEEDTDRTHPSGADRSRGSETPLGDSPGTDRLPGTADRATRISDPRRVLQENRAQLDRLRQLQNRVSTDGGQWRVTSSLGCFTATLSRFGVVGIEGNAQAILGLPLHELQEDAVDLFDVAGVGAESVGGQGR